MQKFQYYTANIKQTTAIGWLSLNMFIQSIKQPKPEICELMLKIQAATLVGDMKLKAQLKTQLFAFTPCVNISQRRRLVDITSFTGLMVLDFDKIDNAAEFKEYLFEQYNFIIAAWISPSKKGVKALVRIPAIDVIPSDISIAVATFKSFFWGIYYEMSQYYGFDSTSQNCVLPLFMSWDADILYRNDATEWNIQDVDPKLKYRPAPVEAYKYDYTKKDRYYQWSLNNTEKAVNNIVSDGHPQLRAAAFALGGYVGAGYVSRSEAIMFINQLIVQNGYLSKGVKGYQRTAETMIDGGMRKPLEFN